MILHFSMWNTDGPPRENKQLYGEQPIWLIKNGSFSSAGIMWNSNAKSVTLSPDGAMTWRFGGGIVDFILFGEEDIGRTVESIYETVGQPVLPPYWSLGYHLCRWGYRYELILTRYEL